MKNKIKELIKNYLSTKRGVSFAEIDRMLDNYNIKHNGTKCIYFNKDSNIIAWIDMSEDYMNAILELEEEKVTDMKPCEFIIYMVDGKVLNLPVVKKARNYKELHWAPCVLN